jgi:hypothetical protein
MAPRVRSRLCLESIVRSGEWFAHGRPPIAFQQQPAIFPSTVVSTSPNTIAAGRECAGALANNDNAHVLVAYHLAGNVRIADVDISNTS